MSFIVSNDYRKFENRMFLVGHTQTNQLAILNISLTNFYNCVYRRLFEHTAPSDYDGPNSNYNTNFNDRYKPVVHHRYKSLIHHRYKSLVHHRYKSLVHHRYKSLVHHRYKSLHHRYKSVGVHDDNWRSTLYDHNRSNRRQTRYGMKRAAS